MAFITRPPPDLFKRDPYTLRWINELLDQIEDQSVVVAHAALTNTHGVTGDIVGSEDFATETVGGVVKKGAAVSSASSSSVSVSSADAGGSYTSAEQTLINELKADVNQLTTDLNSAITVINALIVSLQNANQIS